MLILLSIPAAVALDLFFGDPPRFPHPVVWMGKGIAAAERLLRRLFSKTKEGEFRAGLVMAILIPLLTLLVTGGIALLCYLLHPLLFFLVQVFWNYQALAVKGLWSESMAVYRKLKVKDVPGARSQVARIVGRDTERLNEGGVIRATVETVAENFSDGVIAPLFYMAIGGAPLALTYKAINTMDSMCGYKNERYLYFGRAAAKLDDAANYLPSRIAALLLILAAMLDPNRSGDRALKIWRRDRRKHASPNAAQTESACAGALGIRLGGPAFYFGKLMDKSYLGDPIREIEPEDIPRADSLLILGSILGMLIFMALRGVVVMLW